MPARTTPVKRTGTPIAVAAKAPVRDKGARLLAVIDLLEKNLGKPAWDGRKNALEVLVLTILSQNTSDANALRAYQNLSRRQPGGLTRQDTLPRDADGALD
jgi:endonuclease III